MSISERNVIICFVMITNDEDSFKKISLVTWSSLSSSELSLRHSEGVSAVVSWQEIVCDCIGTGFIVFTSINLLLVIKQFRPTRHHVILTRMIRVKSSFQQQLSEEWPTPDPALWPPLPDSSVSGWDTDHDAGGEVKH